MVITVRALEQKLECSFFSFIILLNNYYIKSDNNSLGALCIKRDEYKLHK